MQQMALQNNVTWYTAIYVRITDNEKKKGLYDSIDNQIKILKQYALKKELINVRVFADEHKKGGNFDRPAFKQMMDEIKQGNINCVMVKDLSRFGREHIEGDYLLEVFFPENDVRLISKLERIDSYTDPKRMNSIEIPLINLFNEQYLRQVSNSTKASLKMKRKEGKFVGSRVPYGYLRSPEDRHQLIVDESVRDIIVSIFEMYLNYMSFNAIAQKLNIDNILAPSQHYKKIHGQAVRKDTIWNANAVRNIITQPILTGDMVQGRTVSYSHKVKKRVPLPKDKWTVVENTHEAIVDRDTFNTAQAIVEKKSRPTVRKQKTLPSILAGFLVCGDCHAVMQRTVSTHNGKKYYHMICSTYKKLGKTGCTNHLVSESKIKEVLLTTINKLIDVIVDVEKARKDNNRNEVSKLRAKLKQELKSSIIEREKIASIKAGLYSDYKQEVISLDDYKDMKQQFEVKQIALDKKINKLNKDLYQLDNGNSYSTQAANAFTKYSSISEITRELLGDLLEKIVIDADKNIKIIFKFQDELKLYLN
jgi:DNA invertase Pin-like site-specific DNA recombinase